MSNFDTHKWFKNQYLKENKIPMYLTSNDAFKKAVEDSVNYQDFEKMVYKILGPKYFKIFSLKNPDAFKDYYNSIRGINEGFKVGDKVTYLGHPAVVTATKEYNGKDFVSVSYDKGTGKTKASDILATDGTVKAVKEDINDPVLMKARAAKMADEKEMARQAALDKKYGSSFMDKLEAEIDLKNELQDLKDERAQLMIDMEQEAEPEGGEIADDYGSRLNDIDSRRELIQKDIDDLRMYESINENKFDDVSMDEYGKPWMELSITQKQELLSYMNRETEKEFETDYAKRRRETSDYMNESVVTESKGAMNYFSDLKSNYQKAFRYLDVEEREEYKRLAKDFFSKLQVDDKVRAVGLNEDSYIRVSKPRFKKDKNNPNFLYVYMDYDTGPGGSSIALGKETMTGQIRRLSSAEAVRQMNDIAKKLNDNFNIEDIEVKDLENGKVQIFAVSDDFIDMDPRSELSMALLNESASTEEKRIATRAIKSIAKYRGVSEDEAKRDLTRAIEQLGSLKEAIKDIKETIKLGKTLNEELCAKGKAYRKRRIAAGEKSSAYLSGRAVKVCKGQMSGKKKKK